MKPAFLLTAIILAGCGDAAPGYVAEMIGEHRFRLGDDPRFAAPDFDDTGWRTMRMPATWRDRTADIEVVGWHRFRFEMPDPLPTNTLALDLGSIAWSDEVFLNGQRIGGTGRFDGLPRLGVWPRLYPLAEGAVHAGDNVLAIRVRGIPMGMSGLLAWRIGIGDELLLERKRNKSLSGTLVAEGLLLGFLGFSWLLVAFFPKRGRAGRATLFLLAAITMTLVQLWMVSATFRIHGLSPDVGANVVLAVVGFAATAYWAFVATVARGILPLAVIIAIATGVAVALVTLLWPGAVGVLIVVGSVVAAAGFGLLCWLLVGAVRARTPGAIPIAFGCGLPALSAVAMGVAPRPFFAGLPLIYYGHASAIACAVIALTRHIHEMNREVQRATEYAVEAHTRERSRLARDLHDGLGQMLALLKLQMQRMGRKHRGEAVQRVFDESAAQVDSTLDELRRISQDLRPAPMEDRGFGEALREYAAAMSLRTDLEVEVEGDYQTPLRSEVGDELYRIAQECLTNCLKHSGARRVVVTLEHVGDRCGLSVVDDGRGLSPQDSQGLGLATIRERSELLGGSCTITSPAGGGTRVAVSVPA